MKITANYGSALIALIPLVSIYWIMGVDPYFRPFQDGMNHVAPIYFMVVLLALGYATLKVSAGAIWTGIVWFPVQSAVFFGFGPLVEVYGNDATLLQLSTSPLRVDSQELFMANTLSFTGISCIIFGLWLHMTLRRGAWTPRGVLGLSAVRPKRLAIFMIIVGGGLKYLIVNPIQWSEHPFLLPGSVVGLTSLVDIGFSILAYQAALRDRSSRQLFWVLWPLHLFLCTLSFSKAEIISAMIFPQLGAFLARRDRLRLFVSLAIIGATFIVAQPWVLYGRSVVSAQTGSIERASYQQRVGILADYIADPRENNALRDDVDRSQEWWTRLDYAGVQARAMELYDAGRVNTSLDRVWMLFVPRIIWHDKPNLTLVSVDFYRLVTGNTRGESFLGISYYGDLYSQYGWSGIFIGCPLIGWLFSSMAARSLVYIRRRDFLMMPAIVIALVLALIGPTEIVLEGLVGISVIYFANLLALGALRAVLKS